MLHGRLEGFQIVERQHQGLPRIGLGYACRCGRSQSGKTAPRLDQQGVHMAVIAAVELEDFGLACHSTSQANGTHGRLSAA